MLGRAVLVSLLLIVVGAAPAPAENATVANLNGVNVFTGSSDVDDVAVSGNNPAAWVYQRNSPNAALMTAGANCTDTLLDGTRIACPITGGAVVNLNGGDDKLLGGQDGHGMTVSGGAGDDTINVGGAAAYTLTGDAGNDSFLLSSASATYLVDGGEGDDLLRFPNGSDDLRGGSGTDTVSYSATPPVTVTVTLDDVANDGQSTGVQANVHSDIENLLGGDEDDAFQGSPAANVLDGGNGADELVGGAGSDTMRGGPGNDVIEARDGEADTVDCGLGTADVARVDYLDIVSGCENVEVAPLPRIKAKLQTHWLPGPSATRVAKLVAKGVPPAAQVRLSCSGKKTCFQAKAAAVTKGDASFTKFLKHKAIPVGAVVEVRITAPGFVGQVVRYTVRSHKPPKTKTLCLAPGAATPGAC